MKQRMFNVFVRMFKRQFPAKILSEIGYGALEFVYGIVRLFLHGHSNMDEKQARKILGDTSEKPEMACKSDNKKREKDLSIIIPAYNAASTIKECLDSVISQKTQYDYEIVVVNDGSSDNTKEIVEGFADRHIKLINQENKGFSGARNRGLDECVGKNIMFLDSDDLLVENCIEKMMNQLLVAGADIVQGSYYSFMGDITNKQENKLKAKVIEGNMAETVCNPGFPWGKIYKAELFEKVRFPLDVWFEDTIVCMLLYRMCHKMVVIEEDVYAYRINPEGITKKARYSKKCIDHYWVMEFVLEQSHNLGLLDDNIQYELVSGHMSSLLYRRISLMERTVKESSFVLACEMLDKIRPIGYESKGNFIHKDIEKAFRTRNYNLWKWSSFIV